MRGREREGWREQKLQPQLRAAARRTELGNRRAARSKPAVATSAAITGGLAMLSKEFAIELPMEIALDADYAAPPPTRPPAKPKPRKAKVPAPDKDAPAVSVFVQLAEDWLAQAGEPEVLKKLGTAKRGDLRTVVMSPPQAKALTDHPAVRFVEAGQTLAAPKPEAGSMAPDKPRSSERSFGSTAQHKFGAAVLIGIVDVGGFDFAHPDFLDSEGRTRFIRIWDQGGSTRKSPKERGTSQFAYGSEIRKEELDAAIDASGRVGAAPHLLEPQSSMDPASHGTHVASIAAGNLGVCRKALIAGVLVSIPKDELTRKKSFYDSSRLAHAVEYLIALAEELGGEGPLPLSINISLGTNGHAHDDSSAVGRWIDAALAQPGRSVCVAAGNAGQERPAYAGDLNYFNGRVHASGRIPSRALTADLEWNVVGDGMVDMSENEMEIWYGSEDRFAIEVKPPGGEWTKTVEPCEFLEDFKLPDGTRLNVYNDLYHPSNGANYMSIFLTPAELEGDQGGVTSGTWLVRLTGIEVRNGEFHCWIERDEFIPIEDRPGRGILGSFPSYFADASFVDRSTVSSLACGQRIVSVANLHEAGRQIAVTSSQGPTRDGRQKPEIAAPGTDVVAASAFTGEHQWIGMSGTSMASPFVAGVIGLMLAINPNLTGAQIGGVIKRTAQPLPGSDFSWRGDAGFGVIDPKACLAEATTMTKRVPVA
jgi:subtilisin family serine protease